MFRKTMLAMGLAIGALTMNGLAGEAQAGGIVGFSYNGPNFGIGFTNYTPAYYPPTVVHRAPVVIQPARHYHVYYRECAWHPWRLQGTYPSHHHAHQVVHRLNHQGFQARVSHH